MSFPGTSSVYVPCDSLCMLFKCMCNNISIEKKTRDYLFLLTKIFFIMNNIYSVCKIDSS